MAVSGLLVLRNRLVGDTARFTTTTGKPTGVRVLRLGPVRWLLSGVLALFLAVFVVVPLAGVVLAAFTSILSPFISPWSVLTLDNFSAVLDNSLYTNSIVNSLLIAGIGGALTTLVIAVLSVVAHRSRFRFRGSLQQGMLWPRMMPALVTGMAFFWSFALLDRSGAIRASLWGIGIAFAVRSLALGYSAFYPALAGIGADLDHAARTSGASWWTAMRTVVLRLVAPAMGASFVLLFVAMLGDAEPAVFLVTDETPVLGLTMLQLAATSIGGSVAALGVIQMVITLVVLGAGRALVGCVRVPDLHLNSLTKKFGRHTALHELSLTVHDGEIFTLLGPSGCGKSTTLWSIAGLHRPDSGSIAFGDRVVFDHGRINTEPEHRNCGVVFQSYAIWPHLSVAANVGYPSSSARRPERGASSGCGRSSNWWNWGPTPGRTPISSPAGSSNGSPWPARWPTRPTCCCWTSRSPTWTPNSATAPGSG
ncbi:hypothetical protein SHKM778_50160 [Streptomyces sp. KM77-8]|uniref:ABC transmembrane type-1 domain-containing protein n=1 Tax=Streptomyces haneummycinicus TaxID=3074435 RepID=A0AAT9HMG3_9ACTN